MSIRRRQREQQERNAQDRARRQLEAPLLSQSISFSYADAGQLQNAAENCSVLRAVCLLINAPTGCWSGIIKPYWIRYSAGQHRWIFPSSRSNWRRISSPSTKKSAGAGVKWNLAEASEAGKVGQMTTLGSDLSVASATSHVGFNIGRINGRLLDLELSALEQNSRSISLPAHDCWPHTCSQPVSNRAVRSHTVSPAGRVGPPLWSSKRRY